MTDYVEPFYKKIGLRLKAHRLVAGITQAQLAEELGLFGRQNVCSIENGKQRLKLHHAMAACGLFGITMDQLLEDD